MHHPLLPLALLPLLACHPGSPRDQETAAPSGDDTDTMAWTWAACSGAAPVLDVAGNPTGYVQCANGGMNRVASWSGDPDAYGDEFGDPAACEANGDPCTPGERCTLDDWCMSSDFECTPVCGSDADCASGEVCMPPEVHGGWVAWPECVDATGCRTGEDCASGECGVVWAGARPGTLHLSCRQEADDCRTNEGCRERGLDDYCIARGGAWSCQSYWDCD